LNSAIGDMVNSLKQRKFGEDKQSTLPKYCRNCEVKFACNGECPKHRFMTTPDGEPNLNYLCPGYKLFFNHIDPYMKIMKDLLKSQQAPALIMQMLAREQQQNQWQTAGRNDPCPCGSGKKLKKCCGAMART
jgi:uncharacterized protein